MLLHILGFILDQLIAKREGLVTLNNLKRWLSSEKQNVVNYDPNNKKYNITGPEILHVGSLMA